MDEAHAQVSTQNARRSGKMLQGDQSLATYTANQRAADALKSAKEVLIETSGHFVENAGDDNVSRLEALNAARKAVGLGRRRKPVER